MFLRFRNFPYPIYRIKKQTNLTTESSILITNIIFLLVWRFYWSYHPYSFAKFALLIITLKYVCIIKVMVRCGSGNKVLCWKCTYSIIHVQPKESRFIVLLDKRMLNLYKLELDNTQFSATQLGLKYLWELLSIRLLMIPPIFKITGWFNYYWRNLHRSCIGCLSEENKYSFCKGKYCLTNFLHLLEGTKNKYYIFGLLESLWENPTLKLGSNHFPISRNMTLIGSWAKTVSPVQWS